MCPGFPSKTFRRSRLNFRIARHPSRTDAKRGDHFLPADFTGLIRRRSRMASGLPTTQSSLLALVI